MAMPIRYTGDASQVEADPVKFEVMPELPANLLAAMRRARGLWYDNKGLSREVLSVGKAGEGTGAYATGDWDHVKFNKDTRDFIERNRESPLWTLHNHPMDSSSFSNEDLNQYLKMTQPFESPLDWLRNKDVDSTDFTHWLHAGPQAVPIVEQFRFNDVDLAPDAMAYLQDKRLQMQKAAPIDINDAYARHSINRATLRDLADTDAIDYGVHFPDTTGLLSLEKDQQRLRNSFDFYSDWLKSGGQ